MRTTIKFTRAVNVLAAAKDVIASVVCKE